MSNYIEYDNKIAFHPGYYIKEIIDNSGLTQADFAFRLATTPKNLSLLIRGEQSLSIDIAMKLARMMGTSINYWLNLQSEYDSLIAAFKSEEELVLEKLIFKDLDYSYFRKNFSLPDLPRKTDNQIEEVRKFLNVATLTVLKNSNQAVSFRGNTDKMNQSNIIKANTMVHIAINKAMQIECPKYEKTKFINAIEYALTLTKNHDTFYELIKEAFLQAGVILVILPNIPGSHINGAAKKIGDHVMLMVNDRRLYSDTFWFTLLHEAGHIINNNFGMSYDSEDEADKYARNMLIDEQEYNDFVSHNKFDSQSIMEFANKINRDPAIIVGRLQKDKYVSYTNTILNSLKHKYKVIIS